MSQEREIKRFNQKLNLAFFKEDKEKIESLTERLLLENRDFERNWLFYLRWLTFRSGEHPWAYELELTVLEREEVISKIYRRSHGKSAVEAFLLSYIAHRRHENSPMLLASVHKRLPLFASLIGTLVSDLDRMLDMGGTKLRLN